MERVTLIIATSRERDRKVELLHRFYAVVIIVITKSVLDRRVNAITETNVPRGSWSSRERTNVESSVKNSIEMERNKSRSPRCEIRRYPSPFSACPALFR